MKLFFHRMLVYLKWNNKHSKNASAITINIPLILVLAKRKIILNRKIEIIPNPSRCIFIFTRNVAVIVSQILSQ